MPRCSGTSKYHWTTTTTSFLCLAAAVTAATGVVSALSMTSSSSSQDRLASWQDRWDGNRIGWHETDVHDALRSYGSLVLPGLRTTEGECATTAAASNQQSSSQQRNSPSRVLVPLCGKTVDMAFLAASDAVELVVGVDGVRQALEQFGAEQPQLRVVPATTDRDDDGTARFERFEGTRIELLQGDFFQLMPEDVSPSSSTRLFDVIYDRASMVAIDPSLRQAYVETLRRMLKPGGQILLVTIERQSGDAVADSSGPPFSIPESEVRKWYDNDTNNTDDGTAAKVDTSWIESVTLLEDQGEATSNAGTNMRSLYFRIQAK